MLLRLTHAVYMEKNEDELQKTLMISAEQARALFGRQSDKQKAEQIATKRYKTVTKFQSSQAFQKR